MVEGSGGQSGPTNPYVAGTGFTEVNVKDEEGLGKPPWLQGLAPADPLPIDMQTTMKLPAQPGLKPARSVAAAPQGSQQK